MDFTVKLKIIPNVFEKRNRIEKTVPYEPCSAEEIFAAHAEEYRKEDFYPVINGKREEWNTRVNPADEVIFIQDLQGGGGGGILGAVVGAVAIGAGFIAAGSVGFAFLAPYLYGFGISMLVSSAVTALGLFTPNIPGNSLKNDYADSKTYGWGGIKNLIGEGNVVPVVYGRHRVGGALISAYVDGDAESGKQKSQYLNYLIALSEGEISGVDESSIKVNDTMLTDFDETAMKETAVKNIVLTETEQLIFTTSDVLGIFKINQLTLSVKVPDKLMHSYTFTNSKGWRSTGYTNDELTLTFKCVDENNNSTTKKVKITGNNQEIYSAKIDLPHEANWSISAYAQRKGYYGEAKTYYDYEGIAYGSLPYFGDKVLGEIIITLASYTRKGGPYFIATRSGTNNQEPIKGFSDIRRYTSLSGKKITKGSNQTFTTVGEADQAVVSVTSPALYSIDSKGNMNSRSVNLSIEYRKLSDADIPSNWIKAIDPEDGDTTFTCSGKSKAESIFSYRVKFPSADRWVIKITRLSDDISNSDTKNAGDTYFTSVQEIQSADVAYNNIALLGIRVRATDQLSGSTPTVTAVINGRLIRDVRNLNAEPSASANPANILYDLITNTRYGAGKYISPEQIDLESFQEFADFCDEIVYSEEEDGGTLTATPRFEMNLVVDKEFRLTEIIHKICSSCRSVAVWNGDKIRIAIDKKNAPTQIFCMGNIVEGSYKEIYSDFNSIPNQIDAQFLDETGNYEQEMVSIFDADRIDQPINSNTIQLYGFTDRARVKREIAFSLRKAKSLKKALEFEAGFDAVIAEIGDIILFQHDTPQYGSGGRIKSVSGNQLILDVPATCIKSGTYALKIRRQNGTIYTHTFSASAGASFPSITTNHGGTVSEGDIWICGTSESEAKPYRIVATEKGDDEKIRITAEEYNESIYNDEVTSLVKSDRYSINQLRKQYQLGPAGEVLEVGEIVSNGHPVNTVPPLVTEIKIEEDFSVYTPKNPLSGVQITFRPMPIENNPNVHIKEYELLYSNDGENWRIGTATKGNSFELSGLPVGRTYYFVVRSRTNWGAVNSPETAYPHKISHGITLTGEPRIYAAVSNLIASRILGGGIRLTWEMLVAADVAHYRIVRGRLMPPPASKVPIADNFTGTVFTDASALMTGVYLYEVIPVDPWGNEGEPAMVSVTVYAPVAPAELAAVGDLFAVKLSWGAVVNADYYEIWRADVPDSGEAILIASVTALNYVDGNLGVFDEFYYFVRVRDIYGYYSSFSSAVHGSTDRDPAKLFDALAEDVNPEELRENFSGIADISKIKNTIAGVFALEQGIVEPGVVEQVITDIAPLHPRVNDIVIKTAEQDGKLTAHASQIAQHADQIALRVLKQEYDAEMQAVSDSLSEIAVDVDQINSTVYNSETGLVSRMQQTENRYTLSIADTQTGKAVTGLEVAGNPALNQSEISLMADKVKIISPHSGNNKMALFNTSGGVLAMNMDLVVDGAITGNKIAAGSITTDKLHAGAVKAANIASGAITADKIAAGSIDASKIAAKCITTDHIEVTTLEGISAHLGTIETGSLASNDGKFLIDMDNKIIRITV